MIAQHLQTFIWLRWRIGANRSRRAGVFAYLIEKFVIALAAGLGLLTFTAGLLLGIFALPRVPVLTLMLVWDGVVLFFLFFWMMELMADLQRSDVLSLENFLHLPVSLSGVFVINYLGSMYSLASVIFLPLMAGLSLGLVISKGPGMLWLFPMLAAFTLMITAITYQFRGWLASLMVNKRRRRTIIAIMSLSFMLIFQLPQLVNLIGFRQSGSRGRSAAERRQERQERRRDFAEVIQRSARTANMVVPVGWLPYGAMASAEGNNLPPLLATFGLALIGAASLRRSYGTTLKLYTGHYTSRERVRAKAKVASVAADAASARVRSAFLERRLPGLSEHASAIAVAGIRSLSRAPEAKMILLSPLVMTGVFGTMFLARATDPPELTKPLTAAGAMTFVLFMLVGLAGNLFGFDRAGFRAFVLSPASRKDILLGKNAAISPFAAVLMLIPITLLQWIYPMRPDHFLAVILQMIPMFLVFCLVANLLSIFGPVAMASGSFAPPKPKGMKILVHLGFILLLPMAQSVTLIPLGIEVLLTWSQWAPWFPAYLFLTLIEAIVAVFVYYHLMDWQGALLHRREQKILDTVTAKPE